MTTSNQSTPAVPPATPRQAIGTAHRLEDGRVLTTGEEHEAYARELVMLAAEDAALAAGTPSSPVAPSRPSTASPSEALTDG